MTDYRLNLIPLALLKEEADIYISSTMRQNHYKVNEGSFIRGFDSSDLKINDGVLWWTDKKHEDDKHLVFKFSENKNFTKKFFSALLFDYFSESGFVTSRNFISDTEVYLLDLSYKRNGLRKYNKYSLRIVQNSLISGPCILVSYDGDKFLLDQSIESLSISDSFLGRILYKGKVENYSKLSEEEKNDRNEIKPFLNLDIKRALNVQTDRNFSANPYKKYYEQISDFFLKNLKGKEISGTFKIPESGFFKPHEGRICQTSEDSNLLLFGNNQTNFVPYMGLKENGPLLGLQDLPIKFIFIFHEDDNDYANKLYSYLKKGLKSFPGLGSFVHVNFLLDTTNSIKFHHSIPLEEISNALNSLHFDSSSKYAAIYISRIKKDSENETEDEVYYKLKEVLLNHSIVSQVVYKENIENPAFNFFLPNIAIALLAKLGGIPWRLYRPIENDLVVGVGADLSIKTEKKFVGTAICFKNSGEFSGFNVFEKNDVKGIALSIKEAIVNFIADNSQIDRLVIHYYKSMSFEEQKPVLEVLNRLDLNVPIVIVTINNTLSKDYVLFDNTYEGKMPQSGTFIKIYRDEYLLCNNTRYSLNTATRIDGFPLPIKIHLRSINYDNLDNEIVVRELIDQVYQFTRMYWKSVRQRNMPVTIEYSEIIAKMMPHFQSAEINNFAKNSLWFL